MKVGGTFDAALAATKLDWRYEERDGEDAKVIAYIVSVNGSLAALLLNDNNIGEAEGCLVHHHMLKADDELQVKITIIDYQVVQLEGSTPCLFRIISTELFSTGARPSCASCAAV